MKNDSLHFTLTHEDTINNETVRINVSVSAVVGNKSEDRLTGSIMDSLKKFIDAQWNLSRIQRSPDAAGGEQVTLTATARVSASENRNLEERAREASTRG